MTRFARVPGDRASTVDSQVALASVREHGPDPAMSPGTGSTNEKREHLRNEGSRFHCSARCHDPEPSRREDVAPNRPPTTDRGTS